MNQLAKALESNPDLAALNPALAGTSQPKRQYPLVPKAHTLVDGKRFKSYTEEESMHTLLHIFKPCLLRYEGLILTTPTGNYKPDWLMVYQPEGTEIIKHVMIEVKPARWRKAHGSARSAAKAMRDVAYHWCDELGWDFWLMLKDNSGFDYVVLKKHSKILPKEIK